ncbi:SGNH/GDSL hydrolase family protein [Nocardia cyriacigeorgica]|uniref:SGNH/GDSL hydrolase family protein n=1 Tax=Nocardia cyriacigeorgica TaxID=135487 RepID=A0A6P1DCQ7_9NOCA|nr:SGNH/GDSL hydrolase family protein [Nocardia cyriacigeorgica]NEW47988.1 SGNH/GDSL hydrolase family protein [Nocardia cyriacigeorgica]
MKCLPITRGLATAALVLGLSASAVASAQPAPASGSEYVSLGDSFISVGSYLTTSMTSDCAQASDDVGHLVAAQLPGVGFTDLACGGTTADLVEKSSAALSPATRYVSISTGGNNEDFYMGLLQNCFITATNCTAQARQEADDKLDRLGARLDSTYATVRAAAPNATIVVLGYLRLLPDRAAGCIVEMTMGQDVVDFGNRIQRRLNDEVARAAERAGFVMVNRWQDGANSVCAADGQRHVSITGVGPGDEALAYHPTITGRRYTAGLIAEAFLRP